MKLIRRVLHEWAHIKGKIVSFQKVTGVIFYAMLTVNFSISCLWHNDLLCLHNNWYILVTISDINFFNKPNGFCHFKFRRVEHRNFPLKIVLIEPWKNTKSVRIGAMGSTMDDDKQQQHLNIYQKQNSPKWSPKMTLVTFKKWQFCLLCVLTHAWLDGSIPLSHRS